MKALFVVVIGLAVVSGCAHSDEAGLSAPERAARRADRDLDEASARIRALDLSGAESALAKARESVRDPELKFHKDGWRYSDRYNTLVGDLELARERKDARDDDLARQEQQLELERARTRLATALEALNEPALTPARIAEVNDAAGGILRTLDQGRAFEGHADYAEVVTEAKALVERSKDAAALAEKRWTFMQGPGAAHVKGQALLEAGRELQELTPRSAKLAEARRELQACGDQGRYQLSQEERLGKAKIQLGEAPITPAQVVSACDKSLKQAHQLVTQAEAQLRDGNTVLSDTKKSATKTSGKKSKSSKKKSKKSSRSKRRR